MDVLGDYTIQRQLEHGAFGDVYLAEHRFIKKRFVIKVLPEEIGNDPTFLRRFEFQVAEIAALDHPNIVKIHNVSCFEGRYFLVMDPVVDSSFEISNLEKYLASKGSSLSEKNLEKILRDVAAALDFAHEKGVVHGSLNLKNVLIEASDSQVRAVLSDFGILRLMGEGVGFLRICNELASSMFPFSYDLSEKALECRRSFVRNFAFLSYEQKMKEGPITEKVDSYAFGMLAYYVLTRRIPEGCFDSVSRLFLNSQMNWDSLIHRCLQPHAHLRPQKIINAIEESLEAPKPSLKEMLHFSELETKVENVQQMAFEFAPKVEEPVAVSVQESTVGLVPALKPQEISRPEYDPDPSSIFQRDLTVSHYTPNKVEVKEVEPILTPMVVIPGGQYMRGGNEGARDEMPRHMIRLVSFALDIHPVTNEQFVRFLTVMGGEKDQNNNDIIRLKDSRIRKSNGKIIIESGYAKHPVVGVTWYGAVAYAKWVGKRLPYESEWEIAAQGKEGFIFPTGMDIDRSVANFFSSDTTSVMSYPSNQFGLYDMAGNVYNWCQDWYAYNYYDTSSLEPDHPKGPQQGVYRVLRGGCWKSLKDDLRCSHRHRNNPGAANGTYGFRCAADVTSSESIGK